MMCSPTRGFIFLWFQNVAQNVRMKACFRDAKARLTAVKVNNCNWAKDNACSLSNSIQVIVYLFERLTIPFNCSESPVYHIIARYFGIFNNRNQTKFLSKYLKTKEQMF